MDEEPESKEQDQIACMCGLILTENKTANGSITLNPFPKRQILDSSKLKEFIDDNFKFDENGRKFSRWLENTVGKGEIARYEQFLLFPRCFHSLVLQTGKKPGLIWVRVNQFFFKFTNCPYVFL